MALILRSKLYHEPLPEKIREEYGVANFYLEVSKKYLSDYYLLSTGSKILGEIVKTLNPTISELEKTEVKFVIFSQPLGTVDKLYFHMNSWMKIRDYGLLPDETIVIVRLIKTDGTQIFPLRDVEDNRVYEIGFEL